MQSPTQRWKVIQQNTGWILSHEWKKKLKESSLVPFSTFPCWGCSVCKNWIWRREMKWFWKGKRISIFFHRNRVEISENCSAVRPSIRFEASKEFFFDLNINIFSVHKTMCRDKDFFSFSLLWVLGETRWIMKWDWKINIWIDWKKNSCRVQKFQGSSAAEKKNVEGIRHSEVHRSSWKFH